MRVQDNLFPCRLHKVHATRCSDRNYTIGDVITATGILLCQGGALEARGGLKQGFSLGPSSHKVNVRPQLNLPEEETNSLAMS